MPYLKSPVPPAPPHRPPSTPSTPTRTQEEGDEQASAGGGNLLNLGGPAQSAPPPSHGSAGNAGQDFFAQLDWQDQQANAKSAGYVPYEDKIPEDFESDDSGSSSGSDSSSDDSSDEFNEFQIGRSPILFSASNQKPVSSQRQQENMGGLLIGNFTSDSSSSGMGSGAVQSSVSSSSGRPSRNGSYSQQAPSIKLIEFGGEEGGEQVQPPTTFSKSTSAAATNSSSDPFQSSSAAASGGMDIFQNISASASASTSAGGMDIFQDTLSSTSNSSSNKTASAGAFGEVGFDPFSAFVSADAAKSSQGADSALGDLLGFGPSSESSSGFSQSAGSVSAGSGGATERAQKPATQPSGSSNFFDPFGSLGSNQTATTSSTASVGHTSSAQASSSNASSDINLLGGPPLMPTPSVPAPSTSNTTTTTTSSLSNDPNMTNLLGEPFNSTASVLTPSTLQSRKLSSPDAFQTQKRPSIPINNLSASFTSNVSFSHPNLTAFGGNQPGTSSSSSSRQGGWNYGMGSVSHNTSPRRSPSPVPPQSSSSTGNISHQQQQNQFDPFGQFNLQQMAGLGAGSTKPSTTAGGSRPGSANPTTSKLPPTGNSYQPYYMKNNQASSRNGLNHHHHQQQQQQQPGSGVTGAGGGSGGGRQGGMGSKVKSQPIFQARPQSPNYNPSYFSNVGKKTGTSIMST